MPDRDVPNKTAGGYVPRTNFRLRGVRTPEYDAIANKYKEATRRSVRVYCYNHTIQSYIPDLSDKRVLDIACGEGVSARMMAEKGAKEVVGVDISRELITKAREAGGKNISYDMFDVFSSDWASLGKFDVVTGIMIIHYADTKEKIEKLFLQINNTLNDGGFFYAFTVNPDLLRTGYKNYGYKISPANKEGKGATVELYDLNWKKFCEFKNYYWSKETYMDFFEKCGFKAEFKPGLVSPEGIEKHGKKFWDDYLSNPVYDFIIAQKR